MEELDLKETFNIFWTKKVSIILITLIFIVIGAIYSFIYVSPVYKSETSLILATSATGTETNAETITTTDITLNQKLVSTYRELVKSKNVLKEVIGDLDIDISEEQLKNSITVSAVSDTQLIKIAVTNKDPLTAQRIANAVAKAFKDKVSEIYKINNIAIIDEAEVTTTPSNINHKKDILMFAAVGLVLGFVYAILLNMLDNTIKGKEALEKRLGLSVLTEIPLCDFDAKGGKK